jgi:hypothetical protein
MIVEAKWRSVAHRQSLFKRDITRQDGRSIGTNKKVLTIGWKIN